MGFEPYIFIGHCVSDNQVELFTICLSRSFPHSRLITGSVTRLTQWVPLVEQEHELTPGSCYAIFSFICMFCRSLFVLLYFFFWPLCCLFFFDIRILIAPLVSSNSSSDIVSNMIKRKIYSDL